MSAALVMDVIDGRDRKEMTWEYQRRAPHAEGMRQIYADRNEEWGGYDDIAQELRDVGLAGLNPLLTASEHRELFATRDVNRMVELVLPACPGLNSPGEEIRGLNGRYPLARVPKRVVDSPQTGQRRMARCDTPREWMPPVRTATG